jgi:hypothetical protein
VLDDWGHSAPNFTSGYRFETPREEKMFRFILKCFPTVFCEIIGCGMLGMDHAFQTFRDDLVTKK